MTTGVDEANVSPSESSIMEDYAPILTNLEDLNDLITSFTGTLSSFFDQNNIPKDPPLEFAYDSENDNIVVKGKREDTEAICQLINSDKDIKDSIINILDIGGQIVDKACSTLQKEGGNEGEGRSRGVSLIFGNMMSVASEKAYSTDEIQALGESAEDSEKEMFDRIKYLLTLLFIHKNPEEDESEEAKNTENGGTEVNETVSEDDPIARYTKLLKEIARARELALEQNGSDKNKYALAIESYSTAMKNETNGADKILMNGDAVNEETTDAQAI